MKFENLGVSVFSLNSNIENFSNLSFSDTRFVILIHISPWYGPNIFVNTVVNWSISYKSRNEN